MTESNSISFGIALPQVFYPGSEDMALVGSFVTRAEELGFESLWVQERKPGALRDGVNLSGDPDSRVPIMAVSEHLQPFKSSTLSSTRHSEPSPNPTATYKIQ